jgi:hypothetical protein
LVTPSRSLRSLQITSAASLNAEQVSAFSTLPTRQPSTRPRSAGNGIRWATPVTCTCPTTCYTPRFLTFPSTTKTSSSNTSGSNSKTARSLPADRHASTPAELQLNSTSTPPQLHFNSTSTSAELQLNFSIYPHRHGATRLDTDVSSTRLYSHNSATTSQPPPARHQPPPARHQPPPARHNRLQLGSTASS